MLLYPVLIWFAYTSHAPWWIRMCIMLSIIIKLFELFFKFYQAGRNSK